MIPARSQHTHAPPGTKQTAYSLYQVERAKLKRGSSSLLTVDATVAEVQQSLLSGGRALYEVMAPAAETVARREPQPNESCNRTRR